MNEYRMDDLFIGMKESFQRTVTEKMMDEFLDITGDVNPLHRDPCFAKEKGFGDRVVYGMLTASLISTVGGVFLPGKNCLIQGVEVKFTKPVYVGDELTLTGEVKKVEKQLKYAEIKITIQNQRNENVLRGSLKVGVMDEG